MRNYFTLVLIVSVSTFSLFSQITLDPLVKVGLCQGRTEGILLEDNGALLFFTPKTFDYYTTIGARLYLGELLTVESENKIRITTDNFISNSPYLAEFYIRAYYKNKKIKIGVEHLCSHPLESGELGLSNIVIRSHNEAFFSYGF